MKKLNNQDVVKVETSFAAATGMCPNNCSACQPSGCACTKCYDSVSDVTNEVKKAYNSKE